MQITVVLNSERVAEIVITTRFVKEFAMSSKLATVASVNAILYAETNNFKKQLWTVKNVDEEEVVFLFKTAWLSFSSRYVVWGHDTLFSFKLDSSDGIKLLRKCLLLQALR